MRTIVYRCGRLGLVSLAYLWRRDQGELLKEMIEAQVEAVVIKVAAMGEMKGLASNWYGNPLPIAYSIPKTLLASITINLCLLYNKVLVWCDYLCKSPLRWSVST